MPRLHRSLGYSDPTLTAALRLVAVALAVFVAISASNSARSGISKVSGHRPRSAASSPMSQVPAAVTVNLGGRLLPIPRSFLGLSTEYWTLPVAERYIALDGRVISLLHVPGDGPFVLRIGGVSSDHTFYDPTVPRIPRWVFDLTPAFVARTARVVRDLRLHVILDLNLVTATSRLVGAGVRRAIAALPPGSVIGFEIGNEPDLYRRASWSFAAGAARYGGRVLPRTATPSDYSRAFDSYARVLARVAPGVPLLGPAVAYPATDLSWVSALLAGPHPGLSAVTAHRYPYSACASPGSPQYPTISRILSENASAGLAQSVRPAVELAQRAGLPVRLSEFNSVTCGGVAGVSNTFATALWAPDAAFELLRAGVREIFLHSRQYAINDPFAFDAQGLRIHPLLYGLILFARTLGPEASLVPVQVQAPRAAHLKAWAVEVAGDTLHVLLLNKGADSLRVTMRLPANRLATVQRLLAPSPASRSGETLGGQQLDVDGGWVGAPVQQLVFPHAGGYTVAVPRYSAALVEVPLAGHIGLG